MVEWLNGERIGKRKEERGEKEAQGAGRKAKGGREDKKIRG